MPGDFDAAAIADELSDCRQRGLDWLDRSTTNQRPLRVDGLERLADEYAAARRMPPEDRIRQIKTFLGDGIAEFERQGHAGDADLLRALFFGDSLDAPIRAPGALLQKAQERFGDSSARFRERRVSVMRLFASFLIDFVVPTVATGPGAGDLWQQIATLGYVSSSDHFVEMLADAVKVTIVGLTNERLPQMLERAMQLKRETPRADDFWQSLRIVFLSRSLLGAVNDEWDELDPGRALGQRRHEAVWARRSVWDLLKGNASTRWALYECPSLPTLNGALLEFEGGRKVVHLVIRRARRSRTEHVYMELEDAGDRFAAVFDDIIRDSDSANMVVPAGFPVDDTFHYRGARNQTNVLIDGSHADGWLPVVLIVTPRRSGDHVQAMLQVRTSSNSAREIGRVSHLTGYVLQDDRLRPDGRTLSAASTSFFLTDGAPLSAAHRVVQEASPDELSSDLRPFATGRYLYPDKESLFFFVYVLEVPEVILFPRRAEMQTFPLRELMEIRANQILRSAAELCRSTAIPSRVWTRAAGILALNLTLHDHGELAERLLSLSGRGSEERDDVAAAMEGMTRTRACPSLAEPGREIEVVGLAGWQHREFFSLLIRIYADAGVTGARELVGEIERDQEKSAAVKRLAELYQDEEWMASIPMEL